MHVIDRLEEAERQQADPELKRAKGQRLLAEVRQDLWRKNAHRALKAGLQPDMPPDELADKMRHGPRICVRSATLEALVQLLSENPKGLIQFRDELAGFLGDMDRYSKASDRPHWLSLYNAESLVIDRIKTVDTGGATRVLRATASILGGMQPDRLAELIGTPNDGFLARFLVIWPDPTPLSRSRAIADTELLHEALRALRALSFDTDADGRLSPRVLQFDPEAANEFFEFRRAVRRYADESEGLLMGWIGKADGLVARLAGALQLLEWAFDSNGYPPEVISASVVCRACTLWKDYLLPMTRRCYAEADIPVRVRLQIRLLKEIRLRSHPSVNSRDIYRNWRIQGLRESSAVSATMEDLSEAGWIRPIGTRTDGKPGKPSATWEVNPELWQ